MKTIVINKMKIVSSILIFLVLATNTIAQNNVNVVFSETSLNNALKVIKDARALNFGEYLNQNGLNAWYLNLDNAVVDIKPNNKVYLNDLIITGGVDLQLWVFGVTRTGNIFGSVEGEFEVFGDNDKGYFLEIIPTNPSLYYSGSLQSVINLVLEISSNFTAYVPNIEFNLGNSLLPDLLLKYFKSGMPEITTTENEIILTFEVLFDNLKLENKIIESGQIDTYTASNSINLGEGFHVKQGATFRAYIIPKPGATPKLAKRSKSQITMEIGDSIQSDVELEELQPIKNYAGLKQLQPMIKNDVGFLATEKTAFTVFPNPFVNSIIVKSPCTDKVSITISDLQGKIVFRKKTINSFEQLDLSGLKSGTYILNFVINNELLRRKIIKQ